MSQSINSKKKAEMVQGGFDVFAHKPVNMPPNFVNEVYRPIINGKFVKSTKAEGDCVSNFIYTADGRLMKNPNEAKPNVKPFEGQNQPPVNIPGRKAQCDSVQ